MNKVQARWLCRDSFILFSCSCPTYFNSVGMVCNYAFLEDSGLFILILKYQSKYFFTSWNIETASPQHVGWNIFMAVRCSLFSLWKAQTLDVKRSGGYTVRKVQGWYQGSALYLHFSLMTGWYPGISTAEEPELLKFTRTQSL